MKSLAVVLAVGLGFGGCSNRTKNLYLRYSGIVTAVAGASLVGTYYFNGENNVDPSDPKGFDIRPVGLGLFLAGAGLVIGTYVVHTTGDTLSGEALKQRELTLQADALLHEAEAAAAKDDCANVVIIAPKIDALDPGVGAVLRSNVAAARCLAPKVEPPALPAEAVPEPAQ